MKKFIVRAAMVIAVLALAPLAFIFVMMLPYFPIAMGFAYHDWKNDLAAHVRRLESLYGKAFGDAKVSLLSSSDWPYSEEAEASIGLQWHRATGVPPLSLAERRENKIQGLKRAKEDCASLRRTIASHCRVVTADDSTLKLVFETSQAQDTFASALFYDIDAIQVMLWKRQAGHEEDGREAIYATLAKGCGRIGSNPGFCTVGKLSATTHFAIDRSGDRSTSTNVFAVLLIDRRALPPS